MTASISVILTAWQRPHLLEEQVERVLNQSIPPREIVLWYNAPPKRLGIFERKQRLAFKNSEHVKKIVCDHDSMAGRFASPSIASRGRAFPRSFLRETVTRSI